jgi:MYXO-CTERM domain-containing protein
VNTDLDGCGLSDAGMPTDDAGVPLDDAGGVSIDAALPDAGFTNDAALLRTDVPVDAGSISNVDAGLGNTDAGALDLDESGCSCSVPGARTTSREHWLALGVIGLLVAGLRRRRR